MRDNLKFNIKNSKALTGLSIIAMLSGVLCALVGEIAFFLYCGALAAVFLYDKGTKRVISVALPIIVLVLNFLLGSLVPTAAVFAPIAALILCVFYKKGASKGECAGYMTAVCSLMIVLGAFALAMIKVGQFSFSLAIEYYKGIYESFSEQLLNFIESSLQSNTELYEGVYEGISEEYISLLLSSLVMTLPSLVVALAFLLTGLSCKFFTFIVSRLSDKREYILSWRFSTSNIFAYFYLAAVIFLGLIGTSDVFGIAIANLQNVFMLVYAYIGFNYAKYIFSRRRNAIFVTLILIAAVAAFSSLAVSILSFLGVYFTIAKNKALSANSSDNNQS